MIRPRDPAASLSRSADAVTAELQLTQSAIARNPKSYYAWHHRKWVLGQWGTSAVPGGVAGTAAAELALCARLLDADERNFHCWNYRAWVVAWSRTAAPAAADPKGRGATVAGAAAEGTAGGSAVAAAASEAAPAAVAGAERSTQADGGTAAGSCGAAPRPSTSDAGIPAAAELAFTTQCIRRNFSNYSAWHYRSRLLLPPPPASDGGGGAAAAKAPLLPTVTLAAELRLVREAVFTEPDDQSPWFYRRWLLGHAERQLAGGAEGAEEEKVEGGGGAEAALLALLAEDVTALRELAAAEATSKCASRSGVGTVSAGAEICAQPMTALLLFLSPRPSSAGPLVAIAQSLEVLLRHQQQRGGAAAAAPGAEAAAAAGELRGLYGATLPALDPLHARFYECEVGRLAPLLGRGRGAAAVGRPY